MSEFIKAEKVAAAALGALEREIVLPRVVWKDAGDSFLGARDDTVMIRVPAYTSAKTRSLRAKSEIEFDELAENAVALQLTTNVYKGVFITDEEMALDIVEFGTQVLNPVMSAVACGMEDVLATEISAATYTLTDTIDPVEPLAAVLAARTKLNLCDNPPADRTLLVGAQVEEVILKQLAKREAGDAMEQSALADATIARNYGGFRVVGSNALPPDEAFAFHKSAFVFSSRAPIVPDGAPWGASRTYAGLAMRVIRDYDSRYQRDRLTANCYVGANAVYDKGELNEDGQFVPYEGDEGSGDFGPGDGILVRAVKLTLGSASS